MGNFYCNFTTRGPARDDIVRLLNAHWLTAYVSPSVEGNTVVFERSSNELREEDIEAVGNLLSSELKCSVLAAANGDDDELWLALFQNGERTIEYSSRGHNRGAVAISRAFGHAWRSPLVWILLQWPIVIFESLRHLALAKLLGIPTWSVASGYRYISKKDFPNGLTAEDLLQTGPGQ